MKSTIAGCRAACLVFVLCLLVACGESNPLLGTWKTAIHSDHAQLQQLGNLVNSFTEDFTCTFTEKELIIKNGGNERHETILYRKNSDTSWSTSTDGGTTWNEVLLIDANTVQLAGGVFGLNIRLRRADR
jgi:hypothetical protein